MVTFVAVVAICDQPLVPLAERSILKPVSMLELSVQVRSICELEEATAARPLGSAGMLVCVVAVAVFV